MFLPSAFAVTTYTLEFNKMLNQIQQFYLIPNKFDFKVLVKEYPFTTAILVGHALRQQMPYLGAHQMDKEFVELQGDMHKFLTQIAKTAQSKELVGTPVTPEKLMSYAVSALGGNYDNLVANKFHVQVADMDAVFSENTNTPGNQKNPLGKRLEGDNTVELNNVRAVPEDFSGTDIKPKTPVQCTGLWRIKEKNYMRWKEHPDEYYYFDIYISKEGSTYVGKVQQAPPYKGYWLGKIMFRLKVEEAPNNQVTYFVGQGVSFKSGYVKGNPLPVQTGPDQWINVSASHHVVPGQPESFSFKHGTDSYAYTWSFTRNP